MEILVISDSHGDGRNFGKILKKHPNPDMLIHCGDVCGGELFFDNMVTCPVKMVRGNCDFNPHLESLLLFETMGHKILVTHGHMDGVKYGPWDLSEKAHKLGADIALYGHTHVPKKDFDEEYSIWIANPGSISNPRQVGGQPSYILLTLEENKTDIQIEFLD